MPIKSEAIYAGCQGTTRHYLGMVFDHSDGWSHSLLTHGAPLLPSRGDAVAALIATKVRLPANVHRVIYGE